MDASTVAIVGAGPVGLYTALYLAKAGINVTVYESASALLDSPRAMAYFPIVLEDFKKSGILDDVLQAGYVNTTGVAWRKPGGDVLASIKGHPDFPAVQIGQHEIAQIILDHLNQYPNFTIRFNWRLTSFEQTDDEVRSTFEVGPEKTVVEHSSQYLVGADGGRSTVRHVLGIPLEGFTWDDFNIVAANIDYDISGKSGWLSANYVVDPRYWAVVARIGKGNVWRVASGDRVEDTPEGQEWDADAAVQRLRNRLKTIIPGPIEEAEVLSISPYRMHQRCASKFVERRIALAGDAAHLTNPVGGLGLTTGWLDAALLGRTLTQILKDGQPASLLEEYATKRRDAFLSVTNPTAIQNRKRLLSTEPEDIQEREEFFGKLNSGDMSFLMKLAQEEARISSTRDLS